MSEKIFKEMMAEAKNPRETEFGDPQITNVEQAIQIIHVAMAWAPSHEAQIKLLHAAQYLEKRLFSQTEDPEKRSE